MKTANSIISVVLAMLILLGPGPSVQARLASTTQTLEPGSDITLTCTTAITLYRSKDKKTLLVKCAPLGSSPTPLPTQPATATPQATSAVTPTPSPLPPTAAPPSPTPMPEDLGRCGESMTVWHPPAINGCATGHEHGDAPPRWIADAGYAAAFHGHFNTSPIENTVKHAAMKGFLGTFDGADVYFRIHAASNPLDRSARFHSYEVWARDSSGGVSHWQGWYNSGDPVTDRVVRRKGSETGVRPVILVVDQTSLNQGIGCEQWYATTASWSWDFGWTICGATTLYQPNENATADDMSTWILNPNGTRGTTRRLELAWYGPDSQYARNRGNPPKGVVFYATQFGEKVSGPNDPRCSGTTAAFGKTYQNVCLDQYIAPTMKSVEFPGNASTKEFPSTGVQIPN